MPEFPIPSARILLVSQIQGGQLPSLPPCPVRLCAELWPSCEHRPYWDHLPSNFTTLSSTSPRRKSAPFLHQNSKYKELPEMTNIQHENHLENKSSKFSDKLTNNGTLTSVGHQFHVFVVKVGERWCIRVSECERTDRFVRPIASRSFACVHDITVQHRTHTQRQCTAGSLMHKLFSAWTLGAEVHTVSRWEN